MNYRRSVSNLTGNNVKGRNGKFLPFTNYALKYSKIKDWVMQMNDLKFTFPLSIQLPPVVNIYDKSMARKLMLLQKYGFFGVELNIVDLNRTDPGKLKKHLENFGLKMTMFASGALAKKYNLSLSHENRGIRLEAVKVCREIIEYAAKLGAGVILGFIKGSVNCEREKAKNLFKESIYELAEDALKYKVSILIEATNHYESAVANTVEEAAGLIKEVNSPYFKILPDTYHMNIEERSSFGTLVKYQDFYNSLHISDNNRYFPGLGALDFITIFRFLTEIGYHGGVAIEGNIKYDWQRDLEISMNYLSSALLGTNKNTD